MNGILRDSIKDYDNTLVNHTYNVFLWVILLAISIACLIISGILLYCAILKGKRERLRLKPVPKKKEQKKNNDDHLIVNANVQDRVKFFENNNQE